MGCRRSERTYQKTPPVVGMTVKSREVWASLTDREKVIVKALCSESCTDTFELSKRLYISTSTISLHLTHIYAKTGTDGRLALIVYAYNHGWIIPTWVTNGSQAA
jgi:DNA-binding CsgD family transcriptional regulator